MRTEDRAASPAWPVRTVKTTSAVWGLGEPVFNLGIGPHKTTLDPLFQNEASGGLHLTALSPLVDAGIDAGVTEDFEGDPRDALPDIGADERVDYDGRPFGDFDGSRCVDLLDFLFLLDYWEAVSPIGGDPVGLQDFLNLLDNWGSGSGC